MESLAMVVLGMLIGMLVSSMASLLVGWRARTRRMRIIAIAIGIPGALLGAMFVSSVGTISGALIGVVGITGMTASAYWLWRTPVELVQD